MSTTTIGYQEDDKLGVLGATPPTLRDATQLRVAVVEAFRHAAKDARDAAARVDADATAAVHGLRKALRRARAVLAMVAGELPKSERRAVRDALREARRGLGTSRDHAVAPETLGKLPLGEEDRDVANKILATAGEAVPPLAEIEDLLKAGAKVAQVQADALAAALPAELDWSVLVDGVRSVYDEARRNWKAAKRSKTAFHAWRRRCKELVYQLDFIAQYAGPRVALLHAEMDGVTDTASSTVDLIMLREFVDTYAQGVPAENVENLTAAIDAQLKDLRKAARHASRDAFRDTPKAFAKRLAKAAKKDLAPPEPSATNGESAAPAATA